MERYESTAHDPRPRRTREAEDSAPPPASTTEEDRSPERAPADQVTPYDHLWFRRRPLS